MSVCMCECVHIVVCVSMYIVYCIQVFIQRSIHSFTHSPASVHRGSTVLNTGLAHWTPQSSQWTLFFPVSPTPAGKQTLGSILVKQVIHQNQYEWESGAKLGHQGPIVEGYSWAEWRLSQGTQGMHQALPDRRPMIWFCFCCRRKEYSERGKLAVQGPGSWREVIACYFLTVKLEFPQF